MSIQNKPSTTEKERERYILVWPDGEYLFDEQVVDDNPCTSFGYTKSDDYIKTVLESGMNHIDLNGMIMVVEKDHWNCIWERELFQDGV